MNAGLFHIVDQAIIQAFETNRSELEDLGHMLIWSPRPNATSPVIVVEIGRDALAEFGSWEDRSRKGR